MYKRAQLKLGREAFEGHQSNFLCTVYYFQKAFEAQSSTTITSDGVVLLSPN